MTKTNAARMLDQLKIRYELREYEVDEDDLSAPSVAAKVDLPPEQVFKTLVVRGDRTGVLMACIPANTELDLKALASASGNKKVELVAVKEVLGLTGYIRGGVSPVGTRKPYPFYMDETAQIWDFVAVSAGLCAAARCCWRRTIYCERLGEYTLRSRTGESRRYGLFMKSRRLSAASMNFAVASRSSGRFATSSSTSSRVARDCGSTMGASASGTAKATRAASNPIPSWASMRVSRLSERSTPNSRCSGPI